MNVLILGATGFIGSAVAARLVADGHAVSGLGRTPVRARIKWPDVRWLRADLAHMTTACRLARDTDRPAYGRLRRRLAGRLFRRPCRIAGRCDAGALYRGQDVGRPPDRPDISKHGCSSCRPAVPRHKTPRRRYPSVKWFTLRHFASGTRCRPQFPWPISALAGARINAFWVAAYPFSKPG